MDKLFLHDFGVHMIIGVYDWERTTPQSIKLDLEIGLPDNSRARLTDNIDDAINYAVVADHIRHYIASHEFHLIEALAEQIADLILRDFHAPWVRVSATKPAVVRGVGRLGITIERSAAQGKH